MKSLRLSSIDPTKVLSAPGNFLRYARTPSLNIGCMRLLEMLTGMR